MRVATHVALSSFGLLVISLNLTLWIALDMKSFYKNSLEIADEFKEIEAASWKKLREMSKLTNRWKRHSKPGSYAKPRKIIECKCPPGPPGPVGVPGIPGSPGNPGKSGNNASAWEVGEKDTVVVLGCIDCPMGPPGRPGDTGVPGNRGVTGPDGHPGEPGIDGDEGEPGWPGEPGEDGWDGEPGPEGPPGSDFHRIINYPGPPGVDGENGAPGSRGLDGTPGAPGPHGASGDPGIPGEHGVTGPPGAPGAPGDPGPPGKPGGQCTCASLCVTTPCAQRGMYRTAPPRYLTGDSYGASIITGSTHRYYVKVTQSPTYQETGTGAYQEGYAHKVRV